MIQEWLLLLMCTEPLPPSFNEQFLISNDHEDNIPVNRAIAIMRTA